MQRVVVFLITTRESFSEKIEKIWQNYGHESVASLFGQLCIHIATFLPLRRYYKALSTDYLRVIDSLAFSRIGRRYDGRIFNVCWKARTLSRRHRQMFSSPCRCTHMPQWLDMLQGLTGCECLSGWTYYISVGGIHIPLPPRLSTRAPVETTAAS